MSLVDPSKLVVAASGGDTVKLFDISVELPRDPCTLTYTPSPGFHINSLNWNHTNLVVASAGDDKKLSLWRKDGQSIGTIPVAGIYSSDNIEEAIFTINFSSKGSRYICSGGSGRVVRIWDLQRKHCIKWLRGHSDTITGAMYNCKDEHVASISLNGELILHNLASGTKAAELKDPNGQVLRVLDYSRISRHLLATAGDDGSIHLWDTTGLAPTVSWLKLHSAPTSGVSFSPSNDKIIASVGLDKKLHTFDSGAQRPSLCIPYEAPFSSLAFRDDGLVLAAGTSNGRIVFYDVRGKPQPLNIIRAYGNSKAVTNLSWQRSKHLIVNENCTAETALLGGFVEDSILMPDPLPSLTSSSLSTSTTAYGFRNPGRSGSLSAQSSFFSASSGRSISSTLNSSQSSYLTGGTLTRLHASRSYHLKDDMKVFSPLTEVQPITPSFDQLWDEKGGVRKDHDKKPSQLFPSSRRFLLPEEVRNDFQSIFDWKSSSTSRQDDTFSSSQLVSTPTTTFSIDESSITPPEAWGGERFSDKFSHHHQSVTMLSRFAMLTSSSVTSELMSSGLQDFSTSQTSLSFPTSSSLTLENLHPKDSSYNQETSFGFPDHVPFTPTSPSLGTKKNITGQANLESVRPASIIPQRRFGYNERIRATPSFSDGTSLSVGSPKTKKPGADSREQLLNNVLSRSRLSSIEAGIPPDTNAEIIEPQKSRTDPDEQQGSSFTLQLFQSTLEETLASLQKSIHEDTSNLHIENLRQFHIHEMEMSSVMSSILENQAELMKEVQSLRKENQQLRQLL